MNIKKGMSPAWKYQYVNIPDNDSILLKMFTNFHFHPSEERMHNNYRITYPNIRTM